MRTWCTPLTTLKGSSMIMNSCWCSQLDGPDQHVVECAADLNCNSLQDVYRSLVGPRAFRGLLRIRTSPEIRITKAYSPLSPVPDSQHLWQLPSCGQHAAVGFDFEYASSIGFRGSKTGRAVLQMAFQYSTFRPATRSDSSERSANGGAAAAELQQKNRQEPVRFSGVKYSDELLARL